MPFHDWISVGWHVATTCHLRTLFVFLCIRGGTYIYVPICVHTIRIHELLTKIISLKVLEVSLDTGTVLNICLMGLGCPLLGESSDPRLRRCAATTLFGNSVQNLTNKTQYQRVMLSRMRTMDQNQHI